MFNGFTMIIACPACATRYVVPDTAIGVDGRTVRCAKCRHNWFQEGPTPEPPPVAPPAPVAPVAQPMPPPVAPVPPVPDVGVSQPEPEPEPEPESEAIPPPAPPPLAQDVRAAASYSDLPSDRTFDEARSSFDHEPPFKPRINRARMWTIATGVFAAISLAAIGAVAWYGLPDWMPMSRPTFARSEPDLVLDFPPGKQDRRTLPNGTEFFGASGSITNVGATRQAVPTILIVLRDAKERIVYSWEVVPPKRQLAPGEAITINEAVTDVPKSAKFAEIGWKPG